MGEDVRTRGSATSILRTVEVVKCVHEREEKKHVSKIGWMHAALHCSFLHVLTLRCVIKICTIKEKYGRTYDKAFI